MIEAYAMVEVSQIEQEGILCVKIVLKIQEINSEVQRELSSIISRELKDPRIHPMTTVVSVEVTPGSQVLQGVYQRVRQRGSGEGYDRGTEKCCRICPHPACKTH